MAISNKEILKAEWDIWGLTEQTIEWKLIDEISSAVFIDAGISVGQATRVATVLIKLSQDNFLEQTNKVLDLLKSEHVRAMIPKATAGGVNLAQVTINELFTQINDTRPH